MIREQLAQERHRKDSLEQRGMAVITGNVIALRQLIVGGSGRLNGDVRVRRLTIEDGATLNGNVTMGAIDKSASGG
jgi:cytoskeletal protein CcmA (bactofilin family)